MYIYSSLPIPNSSYLTFKIDYTVFSRIILAAKSTDTLIANIDRNRGFIFDGDIIKLRVNIPGEESRLFSYINYPGAYDNKEFVNFYLYMKDISSRVTDRKIDDSVEFEKCRLGFIRFVTSYDSLNSPKLNLEDDSAGSGYAPRVIYKE